MNQRRVKIEEMLLAEPNDEFLRYSLALEKQKDGELEPALALLSSLCGGDKPYVAAFFRSAQWLAEISKIEEARAFLRDGIDAARQQGDL
ncbi:MAG: hypothetical protein KDB22_06245, partial [Planctomycetales bacterium]|nr:hypothetical protein [Planctomycetales bacterium]